MMPCSALTCVVQGTRLAKTSTQTASLETALNRAGGSAAGSLYRGSSSSSQQGGTPSDSASGGRANALAGKGTALSGGLGFASSGPLGTAGRQAQVRGCPSEGAGECTCRAAPRLHPQPSPPLTRFVRLLLPAGQPADQDPAVWPVRGTAPPSPCQHRGRKLPLLGRGLGAWSARQPPCPERTRALAPCNPECTTAM